MQSHSTLAIGILKRAIHKKELTLYRGPRQVKKVLLNFLLCFGTSFTAIAQTSTVTGTIIEEGSSTKIVDALVTIEGTAYVEATDINGQFTFTGSIPKNEYVVSVTKEGYEDRFFLINVHLGKKLVVEDVKLEMTKKEKKRRKKMEYSSSYKYTHMSMLIF